MRILTAGTYTYGDLAIGDVIETGKALITNEMIDAFADLSGDRFEIHMDKAAARRLGFENRVAHGLLVLSVIDGLKNNAEAKLKAVASLGWDWRFEKPVLAGDEISVSIEVVDKRTTKKPDRGIVSLEFSVLNQDSVRVQTGRNQLMMVRK